MTVTRIAISLDRRLARDIRRAAGKQPVSAWLADAAERKLRAEGLRAVVEEWESEHGELSDEERTSVARSWRKRRR